MTSWSLSGTRRIVARDAPPAGRRLVPGRVIPSPAFPATTGCPVAAPGRG